jgi:hypothetical protein
MKIKGIKLSYLRNDEHFEFIQFVLAYVKEVGAAALKVEPQNEALAALHRQEDEALKKIVASALTARINAADAARDDVFRGLTAAVRSAAHDFDAANRTAAERLTIPLRAYGDVTQRSHFEETSALHNLLKELVENHAADYERLSLGRWIGELDRRNMAVERLLEERDGEGAGRTSLVLNEVRALVDAAYAALAAAVDAKALVAELDGAAATVAVYDRFIGLLNERIDRLTAAIAARRGRAAAERAREEAEAAAAAGVDVETWRAMQRAAAAADKAAKLVAAGAATAAVVERSDAEAVEVVGKE